MPSPAYRDRKILGIPRDRFLLGDNDVRDITEKALNANVKYQKETAEVCSRELTYYINMQTKDIIISYPLGTATHPRFTNSFTFEDAVKKDASF